MRSRKLPGCEVCAELERLALVRLDGCIYGEAHEGIDGGMLGRTDDREWVDDIPLGLRVLFVERSKRIFLWIVKVGRRMRRMTIRLDNRRSHTVDVHIIVFPARLQKDAFWLDACNCGRGPHWLLRAPLLAQDSSRAFHSRTTGMHSITRSQP